MRFLNFYIFSKTIKNHFIFYPTSINSSYFYSFGFLLGICLSFQLITGFILSWYYYSSVDLAFYSIEKFMRNFKYGWVIRYVHSNGASFFFIFMYLHILKGLFYKSYYKKLLWITGLIILILLMLTSFCGYILPWGQMSYWACVVITNMVTVFPVFGKYLLHGIWGGPNITEITLMRIYSVHFILPFVLACLALIHISILHVEGSSNPTGIENFDNICFLPYFYVKDLFSFIFIFLFLYIYFIFFNPNYMGETLNYIQADYIKTPLHIVPEWYFLFVYGILRCIPSKTYGIILGFGAIFIFFSLILLPLSKIPARFDLYHKLTVIFFISSFFNLSCLATFHMTYFTILCSQIWTFLYYFFFYINYVKFSFRSYFV